MYNTAYYLSKINILPMRKSVKNTKEKESIKL